VLAAVIALAWAEEDARADPSAVYDLDWYLEPSFFVVEGTSSQNVFSPFEWSNTNRYFLRVALGGLVSRIAAGGHHSLHVRAGITGFVSTLHATSDDREAHGVGGEVALDTPLGCFARIGGRFGLERTTGGMTLFSLGPRLVLGDALVLTAEGFVAASPPDSPYGLIGGAMFGFAAEL
jgi:hypothetical protein